MLHKRGNYLFCCDVHNLNRKRASKVVDESLEGGWERELESEECWGGGLYGGAQI